MNSVARRAIVTGGSGDLGGAICHQLAAQGRHDELINASLLYRRMCARLSVGKSLDEPETVDELIQAARR